MHSEWHYHLLGFLNLREGLITHTWCVKLSGKKALGKMWFVLEKALKRKVSGLYEPWLQRGLCSSRIWYMINYITPKLGHMRSICCACEYNRIRNYKSNINLLIWIVIGNSLLWLELTLSGLEMLWRRSKGDDFWARVCNMICWKSDNLLIVNVKIYNTDLYPSLNVTLCEPFTSVETPAFKIDGVSLLSNIEYSTEGIRVWRV